MVSFNPINPVLAGFAFLAAIFAAHASTGDDNPLLADLPESLRHNFVDPLTVPKTSTFTDGERLKFKLGWSFFTVARSELEVIPEKHEGLESLKLQVKTRTNSFADAFYKVRNTSTSWIAADVSRSFEYNADQQEGDRERNTTAFFDYETNRARYVNNETGEERDPVDILPGSFDPLGIVFFVRSLDFEVGDKLVIPTSNGKEFFFTIVHVVDKVKRKFLIGKREAYVLEPDIKDIGGVFKKSPDGKIRFYFSADEEKLPLRMESEVAVGSFWAELSEVVE
jgi:hypothetical protein